MKLAELPQVFREALAYHEAFRRIGFAPDQICVRFHEGAMAVVLKADGKTFTCAAPGPLLDMDRPMFLREWARAVDTWTAATEAECALVWNESFVCNNSAAFTLALISQGIQIKAH